TKQIRDTKTIRHGGRNDYEKKIPYGPVRTVQVEELRHWDTLNKTKTVSGIIGEGKDTILDSARDLILESSNLRAKNDIVLNAKKYILMLSSVNTEYKYKTQTNTSKKWYGKKKVTTSTWIEDNVYANPVEITNEGNVLINYKGIGKSAENRGVFAQGVNFNTKGQIIGVSDGNIYIQGTKDKLNSIYDSQTTKSWAGIKYRRKSDYISDSKEKYKHSQLYGEAGIKIDSEGKLKIEGVDVQTSGSVFLRGKMGVEVLPGNEISRRYEEHKDKGLKISANRDGIFAGVEKNKNKTAVNTVRSIGSIINSKGGSVKIEGDSIISIGSKIGAAGDITLDGKHGIVLKDGANFASIREQNEKIRAGIFANANGKNLSASAGLEAAYSKENMGKTLITPERNVLVTNKDIYIKSGEGNILLQGDIGAKGNISVEAKKGKIYIKDSQSEIMTDNENVKARIALAFNLNLGGIKDTFKSFKDGYKALKEVPNIGRVGSFIKDIVKGRSLLESLEGREKTINAMSTLFNGPSSGGVSAGIGVNVSISNAKNASEYLQHITTNIRAGQDILLKSKELETEGGFVRAEKDLTIEAEKVKLAASEDTYKMKGKNIGANFGVVIYGAGGYSAGINYGEMKSEGRLYNNSHIQAGNKVNVKAEDMKINGGRVEGKHAVVDVKNLLIESVQDKEKLKQIGVSAGYSKQYGTSDNRNNVNAGLSYAKKDKLWVKEQSGIIGTESADVNVKGKLTLIGSIIANINEKGEDGGNLKLSYGEIETRDLDDYDKMLNLDGNISLNQRSKGDNTKLVLDKNNGVREVPNRVDEEYGVGVEGYDRRRITRSTIGKGTVLGSVSESINRDIKKSQELTKGVEVKRTEFRFKSEPNSWGDFNKIMSSNAGAIGNFLDDVNERLIGKERTNHEGEFRDSVHTAIAKAEGKLIKINNYTGSLLPIGDHHGGLLEQIVRTIRKDKAPIIEISIQ
ncbi:hypothetical protein EII29_11135, partial [Leptotrichia sp. OH3620_COT-345]|uniref:hemagglutinin repeat-containing protein n=1 Tax=Leptotrichia sp. OH3620_COT-345 TaxID=2491048 RepID=UPI000FC34D32